MEDIYLGLVVNYKGWGTRLYRGIICQINPQSVIVLLDGDKSEGRSRLFTVWYTRLFYPDGFKNVYEYRQSLGLTID